MTPDIWGALGVIIAIAIWTAIVWHLPKHEEELD